MTAFDERDELRPMEAAHRSRAGARVLAALTIFTVLAFALRWPAVHRMLPHAPEPDAFLVLHAQELRDDPALVRHWEFSERYPMLLTRILQALPQSDPQTHAEHPEVEENALATAAAPYVQGRILVLLLSLALVPLTFAVGRRFLGQSAALIAAFLMATSLLHALFSTQARPHGAHATLALLAALGALRIVERPSIARIAAGALLSSLAIAGLQSGVFTLFPLAAALLLCGGPLLLRILKALLVPTLAAAAAFWAYPVLPRIDASGVHLGGAGGHAFFFDQLNFRGVGVAASWFFDHDPFLFVTTLLGLACAVPWLVRNARDILRGRQPELLVALAYVVPYCALLFVSEETYERFLLPLLPWCAILSAWAWAPFLTWGRDSRLPRPLTALVRTLALAALLLPLAPVARMALVSARPDTLEQAADWIRAHVPREEQIVGSPYLSLPMLFDPAAIEAMRGDNSAESNPWISWQMAHRPAVPGLKMTLLPARLARGGPDDAELEAWLAECDPRWVVLEISRRMDQAGGVQRLRAWAEAHGETVFDAQGVAPGVLERGLVDYQAIDDAARRLMGTEAFGPSIRIWRITR